MECLKTKEVCPNNAKKCKVCKWDNCKEVLNMIEFLNKTEEQRKEERLRANLPRQCRDCSFLEVRDLNNGKVHCFYNVNGECTIGSIIDRK